MSNPKMLWHPTSGESRVFHDHETPPADWLDHHPTDPSHEAVLANEKPVTQKVVPVANTKVVPVANTKVVPVANTKVVEPALLPMTRDEIKSALDAAEIGYAKNAKDSTLYDILLTSLRQHLTAHDIPFAEDGDAKQLLALVPPVTE